MEEVSKPGDDSIPPSRERVSPSRFFVLRPSPYVKGIVRRRRGFFCRRAVRPPDLCRVH